MKLNKYQKYFHTRYLRRDLGRTKIYVVDTLKDNEVIKGEGQGFATSILPAVEGHNGPRDEIKVERIPVTYIGLVMNENTYKKLESEI